MLCGLVSAQALAMPAEAPEPRVAGPQSQGEDRTLKQEELEYCLVLGAGGEDLRLVTDNAALSQKAGVGLPAPKWRGVQLVRGTVAQRGERLTGRVAVLDEAGGGRRPARRRGAGAGVGAGPGSPRAGAAPGGLGGRARGGARGGGAARGRAAAAAAAGGGRRLGGGCAPRG